MHEQRDTELFEIRSDVDPSGTGLQGVSASYNLNANALAHPRFAYGDRIATTDIHVAGDELMVVMYCPRCAGGLRVTNKRKEIRFEAGGPHGGRLSIGPFQCTYPGCGLSIRVDDNVAHDVRV
jgi:hypothetical protein